MAFNVTVVYGNVKRFDASVSQDVQDQTGLYVRATQGTHSAVLKTTVRFGAKGTQMWVSSASGFTQAAATIEPVTEADYKWQVLRSDPDLRIAGLGALIAIVGAYFDASLALGKYVVMFHWSNPALAAFTGLGSVLKVVGVLVAFVGVVRKQL